MPICYKSPAVYEPTRQAFVLITLDKIRRTKAKWAWVSSNVFNYLLIVGNFLKHCLLIVGNYLKQ